MWRINARLSWGIMLISGASLAYEITLTRLFAVQQFYHFAFVVISIATMGFAASGLFLSIREYQPAPYKLALAFSVTVFLAFITINTLPFDSYSIAWDSRQWWILLLYFALSGAPFLAAGWTIGSALDAAGTEAYQPYAANMLGAALGCPLALISIHYLGGEGAIGLVIALGIVTAVLLINRKRYTFVLMPIAVSTLIAFSVPIKPLTLVLSPYKPLSIAKLANQAHHTVRDWGASSRLDVVESPVLHSFPGISLNATAKLPDQTGVYLDGDGPLPITRLSSNDPLASEISQRLPSSIAYSLRSGRDALILDWGAATPVLFALARPGVTVWLPDEQPMLTELLRGRYSDYSYEILAHENVILLDRTARGVLADQVRNYDVIEFALSDTFHPVTSGAFTLGEDYLLTVEAFSEAWDHLNPEGILVITRWIGTPPSDSARAWNTLLSALHRAGVTEPIDHTIAFRGIRTATILVSPKKYSESELQNVRQFLESNAFDALILPDLDPSEANRFNRLPEPIYHELFNSLLLESETAVSRYTFRLDPPDDNKPYFNHFFRWRQTPEVLASLGLFWQPFGGSGYFVMLVLMGMMITLAIVFVASSLGFSKRVRISRRPDLQLLYYFGALGSGYLLIEIPLIQQFTLLLDHPTQSLAGVLFILLFGSAIGSWLSPQIRLRWALLALLGYLGLMLLSLPKLIAILLPATEPIRWLTFGLILLPLGIFMGVPFAAGLRHLERTSPGWIPWAWAVNGAFSGISGVAAAMIALDAGFQVTLATGWVAYAVAYVTSNLHPKTTRPD